MTVMNTEFMKTKLLKTQKSELVKKHEHLIKKETSKTPKTSSRKASEQNEARFDQVPTPSNILVHQTLVI